LREVISPHPGIGFRKQIVERRNGRPAPERIEDVEQYYDTA
jgi:hypothetical protein